MQHTKGAIESENTLRYIGDIRYLTLNYDIHIFFIDTPACEVNMDIPHSVRSELETEISEVWEQVELLHRPYTDCYYMNSL